MIQELMGKVEELDEKLDERFRISENTDFDVELYPTRKEYVHNAYSIWKIFYLPRYYLKLFDSEGVAVEDTAHINLESVYMNYSNDVYIDGLRFDDFEDHIYAIIEHEVLHLAIKKERGSSEGTEWIISEIMRKQDRYGWDDNHSEFLMTLKHLYVLWNPLKG